MTEEPDIGDTASPQSSAGLHEEFPSFPLAAAGIGAWELDLQTWQTERSALYDGIFGYTERVPEWTYETFLSHVIPEDRDRVDRIFREALATQGDWSIEYRILRRDGRQRWIWGAGRYVPGRQGTGCMAGIVQDITERKRREAHLLFLAELWDELAPLSTTAEIVEAVDAKIGAYLDISICMFAEVHAAAWTSTIATAWRRSPDLPDVTGVHNHMDYVNAEIVRAIRAGETIVIRDTETDPRVHPPLTARFAMHAWIVVPSFVGGEWRYILAAGDSVPRAWREDEIQLVEEVAGRVFPRLDRAKAEEARRSAEESLRIANSELREVDRRKNDFLALLSHELRNPLAPIMSSLYILERATPSGEEAREAQRILDRQIRQLTRIVDDLLDVTRISRNKIRLRRERLELNRLVRRTLEDHRSLFEKKDVHLEFEPAPSPVHVLGDWSRIGQSVGNLLQNAVKFTGRGGRVQVSVGTDAAARMAVLRVADTGIGMAPETLARLFEPFMQADVTLDRSSGGLGLGLALIKGMIDLHGGDVSARSAGLGQGSEFVIRLPLDFAGPAREEKKKAPLTAVPRRVLVIEDNIDNARSLAILLRMFGHAVEVAHDGLAGIAAARAFSPDVVLCDIGLPDMDGYEVARVFRADETLRHTFLVALSGYTMPDDLRRAAEAGFDRHVAKPPEKRMLEEILSSLGGRAEPPPST